MSADANSNHLDDSAISEEYYVALHVAYRALRLAFLRQREKKNITQSVIADRLGWNKSLVSRRLHGQENLTLRTLSALAFALECRLSIGFVDCNENVRSNSQFSDYEAEQPELNKKLMLNTVASGTHSNKVPA